jgi:hypothetical protein
MCDSCRGTEIAQQLHMFVRVRACARTWIGYTCDKERRLPMLEAGNAVVFYFTCVMCCSFFCLEQHMQDNIE